MAVKSREDLLNAITALAGDDPSDEFISLLEDIGDTYDDLTAKFTPELDDDGNPIDWKQRYEDNNREWKRRYVERFKGGASKNDDPGQHNPESDPAIFGNQHKVETLTYDNLFKEE